MIKLQSQTLEKNIQHQRKTLGSDIDNGILETNYIISRLEKREDQIFDNIIDSIKLGDQSRARMLAKELIEIKILKTKLLMIQSQLLIQNLT